MEFLLGFTAGASVLLLLWHLSDPARSLRPVVGEWRAVESTSTSRGAARHRWVIEAGGEKLWSGWHSSDRNARAAAQRTLAAIAAGRVREVN